MLGSNRLFVFIIEDIWLNCVIYNLKVNNYYNYY